MEEHKIVQDSQKVVESLLNLSKELWDQSQRNNGHVISSGQTIAFKINSCLYSKYPHNFEQKEK